MPVQTVLMVGHAQLPQGMAAKGMFDTLAVTVRLEATYGVIIRATATLVTDEGKDFLGDLLIGRCLNDSVEEVHQDIRTLYHGGAQNALVAATKDLWRRYAAWKAAGGLSAERVREV